MWTYNYTAYPDELYHYGVLGMKWGVHRAKVNASKAQKYRRLADSAKAAKYEAKSKAIISKHKRLAGKKAFNRINSQSTGKLVAKSMLMGTYGTLKYEQARAMGVDKGRAAVTGVMHTLGNYFTSGILQVVEPRATAMIKTDRMADKIRNTYEYAKKKRK